MTMYHVAPKELADTIERDGLQPSGERAIFLLFENPGTVGEFDVWEIDIDYGTDDRIPSDVVIQHEPVPPQKIRLLTPSRVPGMSMA